MQPNVRRPILGHHRIPVRRAQSCGANPRNRITSERLSRLLCGHRMLADVGFIATVVSVVFRMRFHRKQTPKVPPRRMCRQSNSWFTASIPALHKDMKVGLVNPKT